MRLARPQLLTERTAQEVAQQIARLNPGSFAFVMATGIISNAFFCCGELPAVAADLIDDGLGRARRLGPDGHRPVAAMAARGARFRCGRLNVFETPRD